MNDTKTEADKLEHAIASTEAYLSGRLVDQCASLYARDTIAAARHHLAAIRAQPVSEPTDRELGIVIREATLTDPDCDWIAGAVAAKSALLGLRRGSTPVEANRVLDRVEELAAKLHGDFRGRTAQPVTTGAIAEARASVALDKGETETRCVDPDFAGESVTHGDLVEDPIATLRRYVRRAGSHGGVSAEQAMADDDAIAAIDALASTLAAHADATDLATLRAPRDELAARAELGAWAYDHPGETWMHFPPEPGLRVTHSARFGGTRGPECETKPAAIRAALSRARGEGDMSDQHTCERVHVALDGDQRDCGKPATHSAYDPPVYFCDDCLHDCMEDASPEEQASVQKLDELQPCPDLAEKTALEDRIRTILDEAVSMMPVMPAQEALTLLEEHVHSLRMAVEIAQRREPTQAEGDAHEAGEPSHAKGECYVPAGGWTGRRCRFCRRWVWGGPTACAGCAHVMSEKLKAALAARAPVASDMWEACTGFAASWCPNCGDCKCPRRQNGELIEQRLQWRPASEAPVTNATHIDSGDLPDPVLVNAGAIYIGSKSHDGRWFDVYGEELSGVLGWLPLDALPTLNGGDDNGCARFP